MTTTDFSDSPTSMIQQEGFWVDSDYTVTHSKSGVGLGIEKAENDLARYAQKMGIDLAGLLDEASVHFQSDTLSPYAADLADDVVDKIIEGELSE